MNRTFLIFLMIGTALMIAVIGGEQRSALPGYMPWEIKVLENGNIRVFGITLNKTRIQEANQILTSFPETRLIKTDNDNLALYAVYEQLNMGGFIARLELQYDVDNEELRRLEAQARPSGNGDYFILSEKLELDLLDSRVRSINYIPDIDYTIDMIFQHFGQTTDLKTVSNNLKLLHYPDRGLDILVDTQGSERFSYHAISVASAENAVNMPADQDTN